MSSTYRTFIWEDHIRSSIKDRYTKCPEDMRLYDKHRTRGFCRSVYMQNCPVKKVRTQAFIRRIYTKLRERSYRSVTYASTHTRYFHIWALIYNVTEEPEEVCT
jgi:hypothetical protein